MSDLFDQCMRRTLVLVQAVAPDRNVSAPELKEVINSAYDTALLRLVAAGQNNIRTETIVSSVPALTTSLSVTSTPSIPAMYAPIRLWERVSGAGNPWLPIQKVTDHLPVNAQPGATLGFWEWRAGQIGLVGSTSIEDVKIHGAVRLTEFALPRDTFVVPDLVNPVAFAAASTLLGGNQYYDSRAQEDIRLIETIDAHLDNATPARMHRRRAGIRRY